MNCIEGIILIFQSLLLGGQLILSYRINRQSLSKNRGYFVLDNRNRFYILRDDINFTVSGDNDIIITGQTIQVDGITRVQNTIPFNTFFTKNGEFGTYSIKIPFTENELKRNRLSILVKFNLKSLQGFAYTETITTEFHKENEAGDLWKITCFNLELSK